MFSESELHFWSVLYIRLYLHQKIENIVKPIVILYTFFVVCVYVVCVCVCVCSSDTFFILGKMHVSILY